ncbi:MAG: FHA domain-containing protein [Polyangia bacterium]
MIICSRCGKENQDQFKYCLGCGSKLQMAVPAPAEPLRAPPPAEEPAPMGMAKTFSPAPPTAMPDPESVGFQATRYQAPGPAAASVVRPMAASGSAPHLVRAGGAVAETRTAPPATAPAAFPAPASAPMQDASRRPVTAPQDAAAAASRLATAPTAWRPGGASAAPVPAVAAAAPRVSVAPVPSPGRPTVQPSPSAAPAAPVSVAAAYPLAAAAPVAAAASGPTLCPRCGNPVSAGFAFCGACGHRMKPAAGAVVEAALQQAAALAPEPVKVTVRGQLTLIRPDGTEGGSHPLHQGENLVGRGQGHLFDADPYLSPRHAEFVLTDAGLEVRDLRSLNGVFVKLTQEEPLESGDTLRIGQELLRFDTISPPAPLEDGTEIIGTPNPGYWGRLSVIVGRDVDGPAFPLFDETVVLGRERGDILFPEDGYVSGTHAQITLRDGRVYLTDLGSSNGTFLRVRDSRPVPSGSLLLMGQQLFRVAHQ